MVLTHTQNPHSQTHTQKRRSTDKARHQRKRNSAKLGIKLPEVNTGHNSKLPKGNGGWILPLLRLTGVFSLDGDAMATAADIKESKRLLPLKWIMKYGEGEEQEPFSGCIGERWRVNQVLLLLFIAFFVGLFLCGCEPPRVVFLRYRWPPRSFQ